MASTAASSSESLLPHPCPWPGCSKAYKKLDHLERHQKSHTGDLNYRCHVCGKQYSRSDVLSRHLVQTHGERPGRAGRPRRAACIACVELRVSCDGVPPRVCTRCRQHSQPCRYRHLEVEGALAAPSVSPSWSSAIAPDPISPDVQHIASASASTSYPSSGPHPLIFMGTAEASGGGGDRIADYPGETPSPAEPGPAAGSVGTDEPDQLYHHNVAGTAVPPRSISRSTAGLWAEDTAAAADPTWLAELIASAIEQDQTPIHVPLDADWGVADLDVDTLLGQVNQSHASSTPGSSLVGTESDLLFSVFPEQHVDSNSWNLPHSQVQNPWTHPYHASPAASFPLASTHGMEMQQAPVVAERAVTSAAKATMQTLTTQALKPSSSLGISADIPDPATLTTLVNLYLAHFSGWLPIVDSPPGTLLMHKAAPLLLMAMAALGSVYSRDSLDHFSAPLFQAVQRNITFISAQDQKFGYQLGVVQASLLHATYTLYNGSKRRREAEVARAALVASARGMHLLDSRVGYLQQVSRAGGSQDDLDQALQMDHKRNMVGWCIFLFDAQVACLFGGPALVPMGEIDIPLPTVAPDPRSGQISFVQTMAIVLEVGTLQPLDDIALTCVAYALYRDAAASHVFTTRAPGKYSLPTPYRVHPQSVLDQLARHVLIPTLRTHLRVSCAALAFHSHLQFTQTGLLDKIKLAAGQGSTDARDKARLWLTMWMGANPASARHVFANAAMLFCLIHESRFDTPTEVVWLFDATLCLWAIVRFSDLGLHPHPNAVVSITATPSPVVESWVETGHAGVVVAGLGTLPGMKGRAALTAAAGMLEGMVWGLAQSYSGVLLELRLEEADV